MRIPHVALLAMRGLSLLWLVRHEADPAYPRVTEIIDQPQMYDGEHIDRLVALGPAGVPQIGLGLTAGEEFPLRFVFALGELGTGEAASPLLQYLSSRASFDSNDDSYVTALTLRAVGHIGAEEALSPLGNLLVEPQVHPRVRLAAAAAYLRSAAGGRDERAEKVLLDLYANRTEYLADSNSGFSDAELYGALSASASGEIKEILLSALGAGVYGKVAETIVDYFGQHRDPRSGKALVALASKTDRRPDIRVKAVLTAAALPENDAVVDFATAQALLNCASRDLI
ncbi:MAG: hypothetical protein AAGA68_21645 [Pseudomonadota bacterium]